MTSLKKKKSPTSENYFVDLFSIKYNFSFKSLSSSKYGDLCYNINHIVYNTFIQKKKKAQFLQIRGRTTSNYMFPAAGK